MRLPNGYGSVTKLSGNRRRPYIIKKTIGYKSNGHPIYHILGYAESREKGLIILAEANNCTLKENSASITLYKLFNKWFPTHSKKLTQSAIASYYNAYRFLSPIDSMPINAIKFNHLQNIINNMLENGLSYSSCKKVRTLINQLFKYAIINEYTNRQLGQFLDLGQNTPVKPHTIFTRQQINKLWKLTNPNVNGILILLYTGIRCGEMLNIRKKDINLKRKYIVITDSKTSAGRNRIIPIHKRIEPIIIKLYNATSDYLFPISYTTFAKRFKQVMKEINAKHTTHDCRHTVASFLDSSGANPTATRSLLGHKVGDVTIRVYTHKTLRELRKTINLLK